MSISRWHFSRRNRLVRSSEYQSVFDNKTQRIIGGGVTVLARGNQLDYPRIGIVISSRVARRAVARNRFKRIVRESFRRQQARLNGWDVVVIARPDVVKQTNMELFASLEGHWKKLEQCARSSSI